MADIQRVSVDTVEAMEAAITGYIAQGFVVVNKTARSTTLVKRKEFSALWAVLGFIVCVLPLLVYLVVYALQTDKVVELTVNG